MTEEQKRLVEENHNLIYYYLHKHNLTIDEFYDLAAIGLCKAAISYDPSVSEFSTYAFRCIHNEVSMHFRKYHLAKTIPDDLIVSMDETTFGNAGNNKKMTYESFMQDPVNVEDEVIAMVKYEKLLDGLTDREQQILRMRMNGMKQREIARVIGIAQPTVARELIKIARRFDKL